MPEHDERLAAVVTTLKRPAAALRDAGVRFAVAGGLASCARGGPASDGDADLLVAPADRARAVAVLREVRDGEVSVDLISHPAGLEVTPEVLDRPSG